MPAIRASTDASRPRGDGRRLRPGCRGSKRPPADSPPGVERVGRAVHADEPATAFDEPQQIALLIVGESELAARQRKKEDVHAREARRGDARDVLRRGERELAGRRRQRRHHLPRRHNHILVTEAGRCGDHQDANSRARRRWIGWRRRGRGCRVASPERTTTITLCTSFIAIASRPEPRSLDHHITSSPHHQLTTSSDASTTPEKQSHFQPSQKNGWVPFLTTYARETG